MSETATYKINTSPVPLSTHCQCGHTLAAHGSRGMICAAKCDCKVFVPAVVKS